MNILLDCIIYSIRKTGGVVVYTDELIKELSRRKINHELVRKSPNLVDKYLGRYLPCIVKNYSADIFHSSYYRVPSKRIPTVVTVHDFIYEKLFSGVKQKVHSWQKFKSIAHADAIICVSSATRDDLIEYTEDRLDGRNIHVIHNGVSDAFCYLNVYSSTESYALFVGKRGGYKNYKLAVDAVQGVDGLQLISVGGGEFTNEEINYIGDANIGNKFINFPFVTESELNLLYNRAVCLLYLSSYEGFGIPVIEAMKSGCPVVNIPCKAIFEVACGASITVEDFEDVSSVVDAIAKCAGSDRDDIILNGLRVSEKYAWSKTHSQTIQVYKTLM